MTIKLVVCHKNKGMRLKVRKVCLYTIEVEKALLFFEKVLGFTRKYYSPKKDYAEIGLDTFILALASENLIPNSSLDPFSGNVCNENSLETELEIATENILMTHYASLANGAKEISPPCSNAYGETYSCIRVPGGVLVRLYCSYGFC